MNIYFLGIIYFLDKKFNKDKYLKKLKFKKYKRYLYIGIPCILVLLIGIYFTYSKFSISKEEEIVRTTVGSFIYGDVVIGAYLDDELIGEFPKEDSIYVVDKVVCDNNAIGVWNDLTWDLNVSHITKRTKSSVYFRQLPVTDIIIGTSKYNSSAKDNAYVGYMYGSTGSSNYNDTHANTNVSTIKTYIDNWYTTNLSKYSTYYRLARGPWDGTSYGNMTITLPCPQQNDAFTVSDTSKGNGALTYQIGLLSGDDITFAGGWNSANDGYYLYTGNKYWTASAGSCTVGIVGNRLITEDSSTPNFGINSNSAAVKPVINIKANSLTKGLGTKDSSYTVE